MPTADAPRREQPFSESRRSGCLAPDYSLLGTDGETRINGEPITIGAGPRCVIRVNDSGAKPLCCVVSLRDGQVVARRWAEGVSLNGDQFDEATLVVGDRLTVGTGEFELLGPAPDESQSRDAVDPADDSTLDSFSPTQVSLEDDAASPTVSPAITEPDLTASELSTETSVGDDDPLEDAPAEAAAAEPRFSAEIASPLARLTDWTADEEAAAPIDSADEPHKTPADPEPSDEPSLSRTTDEAPWAIERPVVADTIEEIAEAETVDTGSSAVSGAEVNAPLLEETDSWAAGDPTTEETAAEAIGDAPLGEVVASDEPSETTDATSYVSEAARLRLLSGRTRLRAVVSALRETRDRAERDATEAAETLTELREVLDDAHRDQTQSQTEAAQLRGELDAALARIAELEQAATAWSEADLEANDDVIEEPPAEPTSADSASLWGSAEEPYEASPESVDDAGETADWNTLAADGDSLLAEEEPLEVAAADEGLVDGVGVEVVENTEPVVEAPDVAASIESNEADVSDHEAAQPVADLWAIEEPIADEQPTAPFGDGGDAAAGETAVVVEDSAVPTESDTSAPASETPSFYERYAHLLPPDEDEAGDMAPAIEQPSTPAFGSVAEPVSVAKDPTDHDEDESIDDYLRQMMERIRGGPAGAAPVVAPEPAPTPEPAEEPAAEAPSAPVAAEPTPVVEPWLPRDAPEKTADIDSLRAVANASARNAFVTADSNETRETALRQVIVAAVAAGCGLVACVTAPTLVGWRSAIGVAGILIGAKLATQTLGGLRTALQQQSLAEMGEYDADE